MNPPDFRAAVRQRLPRLSAAAAQDHDIVEDLALQLEAAYESALADGLDETDARQHIEAQLEHDLASWHQLDTFLGSRVATSTLPDTGAPPSLAAHLTR